MQFGVESFGRRFFDCVEVAIADAQIEGVIYIMKGAPTPTARRHHRIYLKDMLLTESGQNVLPEWAFFVQCVLNTTSLRPTASRESFYEDAALGQAREALGGALRDYIVDLKRRDPPRLARLIALHSMAIQQLAIRDDAFFALIADEIPMETSMGTLTLGEFRRAQPDGVVRYVPNVDMFRQVAQIASSQGMGIINAGYTWGRELVERLPHVFDDVRIEQMDAVDVAERFEDLTEDERAQARDLVACADDVLRPFRCRALVKRYAPEDLPALYATGQDMEFLREIERSREVADAGWSSLLANLVGASHEDTFAQLCLNWNNPLIRRLARVDDLDMARLSVQMLYVQSLLMGHHPLSSREMALLNTGLIDLIDATLATSRVLQ